MKKIVALALCLVLALSLCATAFAVSTATTASVYFGDKVGFSEVENTATTTLSLEKYSTGVAAAHTMDTYKVWQTTTSTGAKVDVTANAQYVLATSDCFDMVFVNGNSVTYLMSVAANATYVGTASKITAIKKADRADAVHGDIVSDCALYKAVNNDGAVVFSKGKAVADASNGDIYMVGDKYVKVVTATAGAANDYEELQHTYKADTTAVNGKITVTKVYCSAADCAKSFEFVVGGVADAVAKFGAGNYELVVAAGYDNTDTKAIYIKTGSGTTTTTTTTVSSAKTFDAGIAMYVGMSIMAVTGSAVVIGKKKEF